jgi:transcriptional regulator
MYVPSAFVEHDATRLREFIRRYSFGTLVTHGDDRLVASHLPLLLDGDDGPRGRLIGHMARANPQWADFPGEVLAVFTGPHGYISPSWYEAPGTVPTWNYTAVHVYGEVRVVEDRSGLLDILRRSVEVYESRMPQPWRFDESDPQFEKLLRAIVGFHVEIARIEGKWKLSQNHPEERRRRVIQALDARSDEESRSLALLMSEALEDRER